MVMVTLFCAASGWFAMKLREARRQAEAVARRKRQRHSSTVTTFKFPTMATRFSRTAPDEPRWLINLLGVDFFHNITLWKVWAFVDDTYDDNAFLRRS